MSQFMFSVFKNTGISRINLNCLHTKKINISVFPNSLLFKRQFTMNSNNNSSRFIASIDQGTTSTRCLIFNQNGKLCSQHQIPLTQYTPNPGWVEHDPVEILNAAKMCLFKASEALPENVTLDAIGITNQRETTVAFDSETGEPLHNAIVWLDTRTEKVVDRLLKEKFGGDKFFLSKRCGLPLSTYFSAVKMKWMLENVPKVRDALNRKTLRFGTIDSWLIYNLSGSSKAHVTDVTNASRTMLMNLETRNWDPTCLDIFEIPSWTLPTICSSSQIYGHFSEGKLSNIPLAGCLGDQQAALLGQLCFNESSAKNTYGTGCFLLYNTGERPIFSKHGLLTTVAFDLGAKGKCHYALEGSVAVAGAGISWLKNNVKLIESVKDFNDIVDSCKDTEGVHVVPAFSGLYAPHWKSDAKGTIVGMTLKTESKHIVRAVMEAICFQNEELFKCIQEDTRHNSRQKSQFLNVDGGVTNSDACMQFQADLLDLPIRRPKMNECTALGSAIAAGLALNVWKSLDDVQNSIGGEAFDVFKPSMSHDERVHRLGWWRRAVSKSFDWNYEPIELEKPEDSNKEQSHA